jgi:hypothetical protein
MDVAPKAHNLNIVACGDVPSLLTITYYLLIKKTIGGIFKGEQNFRIAREACKSMGTNKGVS